MRDYNVKPYLNHKSYVDMMRTVPKSSNRGGTPDSEFEKPYMNPKGDYMDMQMNHEVNYSTPYPSGSMSQVDSPTSVAAATDGGGDSLMDAKGIVDGVLVDSPEVAWGVGIPLVMTGYDADGKAWTNITWKLLQPANGVLTGNIYTATDEDSETNIIDNIMGIAPDGKFSNIIVETRPKAFIKFLYAGATTGSGYTARQTYHFEGKGFNPILSPVSITLLTRRDTFTPAFSYTYHAGTPCQILTNNVPEGAHTIQSETNSVSIPIPESGEISFSIQGLPQAEQQQTSEVPLFSQCGFGCRSVSGCYTLPCSGLGTDGQPCVTYSTFDDTYSYVVKYLAIHQSRLTSDGIVEQGIISGTTGT